MFNRMRFRFAAVIVLGTSGCGGMDFSPDGKSVAISTPRGIVIMPVEGGTRELIPESRDSQGPLWSPDSKQILLTRQDSAKTNVYLYDTATRRKRRIGSDWTAPYAWREDGKRFAAVQKHENNSAEIVWYDLAEAGVAQAIPVSPEPAFMLWLPDTDDLAFMGGVSDKVDVYLVEGGEVKRITRTGDVIGFALSASRKELLWVRRGKNLKYQLLSIYRYDLARRSVARMDFPTRIPLINPDPRRAPTGLLYAAFSPDKKRLSVITSHTEGAGRKQRAYSACFSMRINGSEARLVRRTDGSERSNEFLFPVWSRDSSRLGIYDLQDKQLVVAVFDATGANGRRILAEKTK